MKKCEHKVYLLEEGVQEKMKNEKEWKRGKGEKGQNWEEVKKDKEIQERRWDEGGGNKDRKRGRKEDLSIRKRQRNRWTDRPADRHRLINKQIDT